MLPKQHLSITGPLTLARAPGALLQPGYAGLIQAGSPSADRGLLLLIYVSVSGVFSHLELEDWIQKLLNKDHHFPTASIVCAVLDFEFNIKILKCFKVEFYPRHTTAAACTIVTAW